MSHEVSLSEFEGPLGELVQQCKSNRARFNEFNLWLKKVATGNFKRDMCKEGWKLLENVSCRLSSAKIEGISFLKKGESYVNGEEMVHRARTEFDANYGQEDAEWLLDHQNEIPTELQKFYLVFPGTVWQDANGNHYVPCLRWDGDRWLLLFSRLDIDWYSYDRLVVPRK